MKYFNQYAQPAFLAILAQRISAIPYGPPTEVPLVPAQPAINNNQLNAVAAAKKVDADITVIGRSGVPAMHAALLQDGKVIFLDKIETYTELSFDDGRLAFSSLYDPETQDLIPLKVLSNPFCSAGAFLANGRLVSLGGNHDLEWLDPTVDDGLEAIRYFDLAAIEAGWIEPGHKLASKRWYASSQVLGDGRVFVASGSLNALDVTNKSNNNPTYEILDPTGVSNGHNIDMDILVKNQPYWMYPFVHLLKNGMLFVFVSKSSQIFDVDTNNIIRDMPDLPGMHRTYPNTGGSVMLPLTSKNNYNPEIMVCGGGAWQGPDSPADATCGLIKPLSDSPAWSVTSMPEGRCMVEGTLLLDGTVLWVNGAQRGAQGFGIADRPALEALIFDPADNSWTEAGRSPIARLYHSVALMLLDGTVLIAGSNPNEMPILMEHVNTTNPIMAFPTEFRIEKYTPPYLMNGRANHRPTEIWIEQKELKLDGSEFCIRFKSAREPENIKVILYHGGFVTHSLHMGQVMVELEHGQWTKSGSGTKEIKVTMPRIVLAPGPYVVYVVVDGIPGIGQFVSIAV